jgi:hypothetical protein
MKSLASIVPENMAGFCKKAEHMTAAVFNEESGLV